VVFPDADLKFYLDATVEVRARRRWLDYQATGGQADYDEILAALKRRDQIDSQRTLSPLQAAEDAIVIDTTLLSVQEVLDRVMEIVEKHLDRVNHTLVEDNND
jgi:cytidylate kinase